MASAGGRFSPAGGTTGPNPAGSYFRPNALSRRAEYNTRSVLHLSESRFAPTRGTLSSRNQSEPVTYTFAKQERLRV